MTRRELVLNALNHVETEKTPYHVDLTMQQEEQLLKVTQNENFLEDNGVCLHYFQYWGYPTELPDKKEHFLDEYGVVWNRSGADKDIGMNIPSILEPDISLYTLPKFDEKRFRRQCQETIDTKSDKFCFAGIGFSLFERLWSYVGMEDALCYMLTEEDFVHELLDKICDYNLKLIDIINEYDFDGVYFGDDWGQQKGLIMGGALWRKFIKPRLKKMYGRVIKTGKFVLQHSCGDISEIFPDLIEIGLDCYQTFQPEIYDIEKIKEQFCDKLCFWGGISTQQLLPYATPEKVRREIARINSIMKKGGGYILAPTHAVPFDVPAENLLAMIDAFKNQT